MTGEEFSQTINTYYEEIVHWKKNIFKIPSGKAGKAFVIELARLLRSYSDDSAMEGIALKAAMTMPALLLQKPHTRSRAKEHTSHLDRRLRLWTAGKLHELIHEGRTIQQNHSRNHHRGRKPTQQTARIFAKLIMEGKVKAALRLINEDSNGTPLKLDSKISPSSNKTVRDILKDKHPQKQTPQQSAILTPNSPATEPHPIHFERLDGQLIRKIALKMNGAAGPSGLDASAWKRICTSFKVASAEICNTLASIARKICSRIVDPSGLSAYVACRLIALDKCPGVRPIGIGETIRRIIGKAISVVTREDVQEATGALQVCAGHLAGCESAVHAMRQISESPETEAVILVDASNAFNSLNREAALLNIQQLCPALSKVLINTYREDVQLFIDGESIPSSEGTTQGDPLAMAMYALAITPLIHRIKDNGTTRQIWYADDATAGGKLHDLKSWWDDIARIGPEYGYHPNPAKTWLIVKEHNLTEATELFRNTGVSITTEGKRHLGAAIGTRNFVEEYVQQRVATWVLEVEHLSSIAITQPHAAYSAFTHGLLNKWNYLARTVPNVSDLFQPLEDAIQRTLLPSITGQNAFNNSARELMALPTRLGGLGITNPSKHTTIWNETSEKITAPLVALILQQSDSYPPEAKEEQVKEKNNARCLQRQQDSEKAIELKGRLPNTLQRAMDVSSEKGASSWLTTLPIAEHGFALHKGAFRDALCLRYGWRPSHLPSNCICGKQLTVEHALSCSRGGFPSIRHNEVRDITADLLSQVCHNVGTEPALQPVTDEEFTYRSAIREDGARLDVAAESFWSTDRQRAFFDVRVFNPFAQSHRNTPLTQCYKKNEQEKKRAYDERVREVEHGTFSPLVFSTSGGMGATANVVYKRLASMIAEKQDQPYSRTIQWIRCRLCFSLLRSAIMCLRGSRSTYHHPTGPDNIELASSEGRISSEEN